MDLRAYATVLAILSFMLLGVACSSGVGEGLGTLPAGMQDDLVPDIEYDLYLYFNPDRAVALDYRRFLGTDQEEILPLGDDDDVALSRVSMVATSLGQFGGSLGFATSSDAELVGSLLSRSETPLPLSLLTTVSRLSEKPPAPLAGLATSTLPTASEAPLWTVVRVSTSTVQIIRGDAEWTEEIARQLESAEAGAGPTPVKLKEKSPQAWNMLTNLPVSEDEPPVAAGLISTDDDLIQEIADSAGIQVPGLDTAFGIVRVDNVAFGIYSKLPESIPEEIEVDLLDSLDTGVVLVGGAGYAGVAVAFLVRSIAGKIGMDTIALDNTNARYLELEDGHLIIKNKGSLIYATVAGDRGRAEELMLRALAE